MRQTRLPLPDHPQPPRMAGALIEIRRKLGEVSPVGGAIVIKIAGVPSR